MTYNTEDLEAAYETLMDVGPRGNPEHDPEKHQMLDEYVDINLMEALQWYSTKTHMNLPELIESGAEWTTGLAVGLILAKQKEEDGS